MYSSHLPTSRYTKSQPEATYLDVADLRRQPGRCEGRLPRPLSHCQLVQKYSILGNATLCQLNLQEEWVVRLMFLEQYNLPHVVHMVAAGLPSLQREAPVVCSYRGN